MGDLPQNDGPQRRRTHVCEVGGWSRWPMPRSCSPPSKAWPRTLGRRGVAAAWGKLSVSDLSLQACEASGVLKAIRKVHPQLRGGDRPLAIWALKRIPSSKTFLSAQSKSFRLTQAAAQLMTGGIDPQSAFVTASQRAAGQRLAIRASLRHALQGEVDAPWRLPVLVCGSCGERLPHGARSERSVLLCDARFTAGRGEKDRLRQQKRQYGN